MTTTALATFPGDADSADVTAVLAELTATAQPFGQWDRAHSEHVQELAGWLHCAAMWRGQDLTEAVGAAESSPQDVVHGLITAHASMLARQEAEITPFKGPDGALLGNDYDDHDECAERHAAEKIQMLGMVMAVLSGEFGRPVRSPEPEPDVQAGMLAVLGAMTDPDLEGGDIVETIKERLHALGFDLTVPDEDA